LKGYRSQFDEVADYNIIFHASYENALKKSVAILQDYVTNDLLEEKAKNELIASYNASLKKIASESEAESDHYVKILDDSGKAIKGVKVHRETGIAYVFGLLHRKHVIQAGEYKSSNKQPFTLIKDKLRKLTPVNKWRQFIVKPGQVEAIKVENLTVLP
jgi:hypothetical protein